MKIQINAFYSLLLIVLMLAGRVEAQVNTQTIKIIHEGDTLVLDGKMRLLFGEQTDSVGHLSPSVVGNNNQDVILICDTLLTKHKDIRTHLAKQESSKDLLKIKAVGRFDRGIRYYRFIPHKKWIGGLTFSYANFDSSDNHLLFSFIKDFSMNIRSFSVKPFFGYAIKDNQVLGMKLGYDRAIGKLDNLSLEIDEDLSFKLHDMRYTEDMYSVSLFHRSYVGLDPGKRFGFFNETSLSYRNGTSSFVRRDMETPQRTETIMNELNIGIKPGLAVFIMENVAAEFSVGVIGFEYRTEKQKNSDGTEGSRRTSGADFKINLFNINIGIVACF